MQVRSIALAAAAACCAPAFAAPTVSVDAAATVRIYMTGASALRNSVFGLVLNDICGTSAANASTTLYNVTEGSGGVPSFSGNNWAITCVLPAAKVGLAAGTALAFFKSDAGGSANGVFPVFYQDTRPQVQPVPLAGCTTTAIADRAYTGCPVTRDVVPYFGISDLEPAVFRGANVPNDPLDAEDDTYPSGGLTSAQIALMQVTPVVQTVFAVAVNRKLYDAMFTKQNISAKKDNAGAACTNASTDENCIPSVGYAEARSFFQGTETNWKLLVREDNPSTGANEGDALIDSQVNVCRRVQGSGTQSAANLTFFGVGCNSGAGSPADWSYSSSASPSASSSLTNATEDGRSFAQYFIDNMGGGAGTGPMPVGTQLIFEGPGTGDVRNCLTAANKAQGYAIGHVSRENSEATADWKFVKLEGAVPHRDKLKAGQYDYAYESTVQYLKTAYNALSTQQRAFITGFTSEIKLPNALVKLPSANQNGVAALPSAYPGVFGFGPANDVLFGSRVTRAGKSCNGFTAIK
jgi:hypothetical protein